MLTDTELIRKLDIFQTLDDKIIRKIAQTCIAREFVAGDYIVKQGATGLGLYFITRGRAKVEIDQKGAKVVVAELRDGDFLGELSMIDGRGRSADVICLEDTTCMLLTRDGFTRLVNKYPQIALHICKSLVSRIRATNERVAAVPGLPLPGAVPISSPPTAMATKAAENASPESRLQVFRLYTSTKNRARDMLVDLFGSLYMMKMMTVFSTAIMGCPIDVQPENRRSDVVHTSLDGVKLALFPACRDQVLRIAAFDSGDISATVFQPAHRGNGSVLVAHFQGHVWKDQRLRLHILAKGDTFLEAPVTPQAPSLSMWTQVLQPYAWSAPLPGARHRIGSQAARRPS